MNCLYCKHKCLILDEKGPVAPSRLDTNFNSWECLSCTTHFFRWKEEKIYRIKIFFTLQDKKYVYYDDLTCGLLYDMFWENGVEYAGAHPIITFENPPHITPFNIKEKIKTYLIFS